MIHSYDAARRISELAGHLHTSRAVIYRALISIIALDTRAALQELSRRQLFLVTSTGRTATKWLAGLLDCAFGACVFHEPVIDEQHWHPRALQDPAWATRYICTFRVRDMALRTRACNPAVYGEVNSALRFFVEPLQRALPHMRMIHLVRDGRDVVRSVIVRRGSRPQGNLAYHNLKPPALDAVSSRWDTLSVFEQVCWGWQYENSLMRTQIPALARLEDIISSYALFQRQILDPLGLTLPHEIWEQKRRRPQNATKVHPFPAWQDWTPRMRDQFSMICGPEMRASGYDID